MSTTSVHVICPCCHGNIELRSDYTPPLPVRERAIAAYREPYKHLTELEFYQSRVGLNNAAVVHSKYDSSALFRAFVYLANRFYRLTN